MGIERDILFLDKAIGMRIILELRQYKFIHAMSPFIQLSINNYELRKKYKDFSNGLNASSRVSR